MGPEIDVLIRGVSYKRDSYIRAFVSHNKEHLRRNQIFCFLIRGIHCKRASYKQVPLYKIICYNLKKIITGLDLSSDSECVFKTHCNVRNVKEIRRNPESIITEGKARVRGLEESHADLQSLTPGSEQHSTDISPQPADTLTRCTAEGPAVEAGGPQCQRCRQAADTSAATTTPSAKLPPRPYSRAHTATAGLETVRCSAADQVFLLPRSPVRHSQCVRTALWPTLH